ncbi:SET and MYND domain-containing protein 4-like [Copidosoma floridanum]|uniref:SET and MYND domain-containing protein 4-like n=1 Tax=Copidosoma floridanum TaxID=29053 RepID=UPI0006C9826A|nr:SET and MYND domain-containing protein 4-like [Copidosoma floridanum]
MYHSLLTNLIVDVEVYEQLVRMTDFQSRIIFILRALEKHLPFPCAYTGKNNDESVKLRNEAEALTSPNNDLSVLLNARKLYSQSVALAEQSSDAMIRAYANRSCVLYYLSKFEECIRDIDRALKGNYPDKLRPNLLIRKAKCLKILGREEDFNEVYKEISSLLRRLDISDEVKEILEMRINSTVNKIDELLKLKDTSVKPPSFVPHIYIPSASEVLDLKFNEKFGRHYVATRDIKPGECLIAEKTYAMIINPSNIYTHCSHCLMKAWDSIPCEHCIYAMYCSTKCKDDAWKQYHDIECPVKGYLFAAETRQTDIFSLKLTLLAVREFGSIENLRREFNKIDNCKDNLNKSFSDDGIYHNDQYRPLYSLMTHEKNRDPEDILIISLNSAVVLFYVHIYTNFFSHSNKSVSALCENADALFFGQQIAQNCMKIQQNGHQISELHSCDLVEYGRVVGSVISILNHSCDPNATRCPVVIDNVIHQAIFALQPIPKGSQVLDNYGCHYDYVSKVERDEILSRYFFKCYCQACDENWPLKEFLPPIHSFITNKKDANEIEKLLKNCQEWRKKYHQYTTSRNFDVNLVSNFKVIIQAITKIYKTTPRRPSREYADLLDSLRYALQTCHIPQFEQ